MSEQKIPVTWEKWCKSGKLGKGAIKKNAVQKCLKSGHVWGHFSDVVLRPDLEYQNSMYPSLEHLSSPKDHSDVVVEARIFNDMKSHLSEDEFWKVIEHFFAVGLSKGKIKPPFGKRLPKGWSPTRHYSKEEARKEDANQSEPATS